MKSPLFIHIPKTAGMSIRAVVNQPSTANPTWRHGTQENWMDLLGESYSSYTKFTVVRNPLTRFWSAWRYLKSQNPNHKFYISDSSERVALAQFSDPADFLEAVGGNIDAFLHFAPQWHWLCSDMDYILRFESLSSDFSDMCKKEGWHDFSLPHTNKTISDLPLNPDESLPGLIKMVYAYDYRRFGYEWS